ncbi:hypothetical protein HDV00_003722 [Rhizophlyctis rosea]|nr:hypothetical protein HDV00_003722 [Rhizophlyctis rosea]
MYNKETSPVIVKSKSIKAGKLEVPAWEPKDGERAKDLDLAHLDGVRMSRAIKRRFNAASKKKGALLSVRYKMAISRFFYLYASHDDALHVFKKDQTWDRPVVDWVFHDGHEYKIMVAFGRIDPSIGESRSSSYPPHIDLFASLLTPSEYAPLKRILVLSCDADITRLYGMVFPQPTRWWSIRTQDEDKPDRRDELDLPGWLVEEVEEVEAEQKVEVEEEDGAAVGVEGSDVKGSDEARKGDELEAVTEGSDVMGSDEAKNGEETAAKVMSSDDVKGKVEYSVGHEVSDAASA